KPSAASSDHNAIANSANEVAGNVACNVAGKVGIFIQLRII
ncbi:MAG: hypothetical protein RL761_289, partial [Pseudomonadota bacterium]